MGYYNFRCRKCDKVISISKKSIDQTQFLKGATMSKAMHPSCKAGIEDGEKVFADLISYSKKPLRDTVDIIENPKGNYLA